MQWVLSTFSFGCNPMLMCYWLCWTLSKLTIVMEKIILGLHTFIPILLDNILLEQWSLLFKLIILASKCGVILIATNSFSIACVRSKFIQLSMAIVLSNVKGWKCLKTLSFMKSKLEIGWWHIDLVLPMYAQFFYNTYNFLCFKTIWALTINKTHHMQLMDITKAYCLVLKKPSLETFAPSFHALEIVCHVLLWLNICFCLCFQLCMFYVLSLMRKLHWECVY